MKYLIIFYFLIVFILVAWRLYTNYLESERFRGDGIYTNPKVKKLISKFLPKSQNEKIRLENHLFILDRNFTVEGFVLLRIIVFIVALLLSVSIANTIYLDNKSSVFEKKRDIPFLISKEEYFTLIDGITFEELNQYKEMNQISANSLNLESYDKISSVNSLTLYEILKDINKDYNSKLILYLCLLIVALMSYLGIILPVKIKNALVKNLLSQDFEEFVKLESFIYVNTDSTVEELLEGLISYSHRFNSMFKEFKYRYNYEGELAFEKVLKFPNLPSNFRKLLEYLHLIETGETQSVRYRINVTYENNLERLKRIKDTQRELKKNKLKSISMKSIIVSIISVVLPVVMEMDFKSILRMIMK